MAANEFFVENAVYIIMTLVHVVLTLIQVNRISDGHLPSRLSRGPIYGAMMATVVEIARSVDPSAAYGRYQARYLPIFSISISCIIIVATAQVFYESIATLFHEAVRHPDGRKYRSKGLARMRRWCKGVAYFAIFMALLSMILAAADNRQVYEGLWAITMVGCFIVLIMEISLGGRWLRVRLRRHYAKIHKQRKQYAQIVHSHLTRLTYFRYSFVGILLAALVGILIVGVTKLVSTKPITSSDPEKYDFLQYASMWLQGLIVSVCFFFGWIPHRKLAKTQSVRALEQIQSGDATDVAAAAPAPDRTSSGGAAEKRAAAKKDDHRRLTTEDYNMAMREQQIKKFQSVVHVAQGKPDPHKEPEDNAEEENDAEAAQEKADPDAVQVVVEPAAADDAAAKDDAEDKDE